MERGYRELKVFERAFQAALEIHSFSLDLPKIEQYALADQLRRATKGICANIAEGHAKNHYSKAEFRRFVMMALGSSEEVRVWLRFCLELKYLHEEQWQKWDILYSEISKMLNGLVKSL